MKKIDEKNHKDVSDEKTNEDEEKYRRVKMFYDSLYNCNKAMVFIDAKHWYVQID